ncbi:pyridoxal phosphate-dependent aminotransferase [bacterium]|nr:pyridoxal phosphate-dependent aminotransferase [bacterium]
MPSQRSQKIKSFIAMDILEASHAMSRRGIDVVSFSLGEPDFQAPACVQEACIKAIQNGTTKYTHSQGSYVLREEIARHYQTKYGVTISPDQIIITQGTSPAFFLIFSTLLEKGDGVVLPNPHYPCDANFVEFLGGKNQFLKVHEEDDYQWDLKALKKIITKKTKALFVTSPSNPTGSVLTADVLKGIAKTKIPIVSDEIYHGLVYEGSEHTMLEFTNNCIVVGGFSKSYAMTGYRLGYLIAPPKYIRLMQKIQQNFFISANSFVQEAGIAALREGGFALANMRAEYNKRRLVMMQGLRDLGFKINYNPNGAFYIFVKSSHLRKNSYKLAFDILENAHVGVTPGIDFGSEGEGHLRFSYATSIPVIEEGLKRLKAYISSL